MKKVFVVKVTEEATSAGGPEQHLRDAELIGGVEGEAHAAVGDDAGERRDVGIGVETAEEGGEGGEGVDGSGVTERRDVLSDLRVRRREAVGDRLEPEGGDVGGDGAGVEEAAVVELRVDEGDVEALRVEELGKVHDRLHVALRRERDTHRVWLSLLYSFLSI